MAGVYFLHPPAHQFERCRPQTQSSMLFPCWALGCSSADTPLRNPGVGYRVPVLPECERQGPPLYLSPHLIQPLSSVKPPMAGRARGQNALFSGKLSAPHDPSEGASAPAHAGGTHAACCLPLVSVVPPLCPESLTWFVAVMRYTCQLIVTWTQPPFPKSQGTWLITARQMPLRGDSGLSSQPGCSPRDSLRAAKPVPVPGQLLTLAQF